MRLWKKTLHSLQNTSITVKLGGGVVLLLILIVAVSATGYLSLQYVKNTNKSISLSTEIQRLALEMDRGMEKARYLHGQFFIQYPKIGLKTAHEHFAQPSVRKAAQVISTSNKFRSMILEADVSGALRASKVDLNLYLSSAKRFADTSIESVRLVTRLATPETGLEAQLEKNLISLNALLSDESDLANLFHQMEYFIHKHHVSRERFLMQSAFNLSFNLRDALNAKTALDPSKIEQVSVLLDTIKELSEEILEVDTAIKAKFKDFDLQEKAAVSISATLIELAEKEVEKSENKISNTYKLSHIMLSAVTLLGMISTGFIAWFLHTNITQRIVRLTRSAEELRKGRLDVLAEVAPEDELGKFGQTFNVMSGRIKDLIDTLEEKIAEQTLNYRRSEKKYRQLVEGSEDLITKIDAAGKFIFVNKACADVFGLKVEKCLGISAFSFVHKDDRERTKRDFNKCIELKKTKAVFENRHISKDGEIHHMIWKANFAYDSNGAVISVDSIGRDISPLKKAETFLKREKEKAQKYLDIVGVLLVALDTNGNIVLINQQGCSILRVAEQEALGQNWFDLYLPKRIRKDVWAVFEKLMTGNLQPVEYYENEILTSEGDERTIAFHNSLLKDNQGNIEGVLFSGEDITEKKKSNAEKERLELELRQARKMEAIGTLAGGIAHDFNNILAAIFGYAEIVKSDLPDESPSHNDIDQILKAGKRAQELVKQILTFSRKGMETAEPMLPAAVIMESIKFVRASLPTTVEIQEEISTDCGWIIANPTNIHQVVVNLCTNALHAMENEKGILTVKVAMVEVTQKDNIISKTPLEEGSYVELMVRDTGHGMDESTIERIFEPYFTTKEVGKGSGMGLALVHGIIQGCKGGIKVESAPGKGTSFYVYFPLIEKDAVEIVEEGQPNPLPRGDEVILAVDDEEPIVEMYKAILEPLGYSVVTQYNSEKALEIFRSSPDSFDLIITDQTMPYLPGSELTKEILKIRPDIPVILCTGYSSMVSEKTAIEIGVKRFVTKPLSKKDLATIVREVLDKGSSKIA